MACSVRILWNQQDGKCYFCQCQTYLKQEGQSKMRKRTASREHLIPKSEGGSNRKVNLRMACHKCNTDRGTMHAVLWMQIVRNPAKLQAFYRARSLQKKLTKMRNNKKREARLLRNTGMFHKIIHVNNHTFNRLFTVQCAA